MKWAVLRRSVEVEALVAGERCTRCQSAAGWPNLTSADLARPGVTPLTRSHKKNDGDCFMWSPISRLRLGLLAVALCEYTALISLLCPSRGPPRHEPHPLRVIPVACITQSADINHRPATSAFHCGIADFTALSHVR